MVIQILDDMLRAYILDLGGSQEDHIPLVKFACNNKYQASIGMTPYEALYGRRYRSSIFQDEIGERKLLGPKFVQVIVKKVTWTRERLKIVQSRQKSYVDNEWCKLMFKVEDHVFLKVLPMKAMMRFRSKGRLSP